MRFFRTRSPWQYGVIVVCAVGFYVLLGYAKSDPPPRPHEPSFVEQVAAVRAGKSVAIRLDETSVDDEQLAEVAKLDTLERLNVPDSQFTDAGLAHLAKLPKLTLLRFGTPKVTDAGLRHIARMKSLRFLHLIDVPLTDAGLAELHGMTWLESFYLDGGRATDDGLTALIQALPELHFHKDQLHLPADPRKH